MSHPVGVAMILVKLPSGVSNVEFFYLRQQLSYPVKTYIPAGSLSGSVFGITHGYPVERFSGLKARIRFLYVGKRLAVKGIAPFCALSLYAPVRAIPVSGRLSVGIAI